jgi:hypothetical protein
MSDRVRVDSTKLESLVSGIAARQGLFLPSGSDKDPSKLRVY